MRSRNTIQPISPFSRLASSDDPYSLGAGWSVHATRNTQRNVMQLSAFYQGEFAFELLDIVPARCQGARGFAIRLCSTSTRKRGSYYTQSEALQCGKQWLRQFPKYAIDLRDQFQKDKS